MPIVLHSEDNSLLQYKYRRKAGAKQQRD